MIRKNVHSSNIRSIGYNEKSKVLEIKFHESRIYQYFNVPKYVYHGLINAQSHGSYFHSNIKGKYNYQRIK
jgi:hypothetical protein